MLWPAEVHDLAVTADAVGFRITPCNELDPTTCEGESHRSTTCVGNLAKAAFGRRGHDRLEARLAMPDEVGGVQNTGQFFEEQSLDELAEVVDVVVEGDAASSCGRPSPSRVLKMPF